MSNNLFAASHTGDEQLTAMIQIRCRLFGKMTPGTLTPDALIAFDVLRQ